ncbi:AdoMet dependent proline di-methyltransferase [Teratosphaeria destructans]|uniref:Alpha N-terminal protein methyltransferase 1 n=1 Tax=Teratosphaeria destructans TaxID=418781 RepID=A0A9W7SY16_9PEZI|nr:AdoMet dependent proline di-methyltransferase [Teratosphaeria destructans]
MPSPKRKNEAETQGTVATKKAKTGDASANDHAAPQAVAAAPDSHIDHEAAIKYWSSTEPTVNGVLGGFPEVSKADLQGSSNFLAKLRRPSKHHPPGKKLGRAVDCGAGIGRVTDGFLKNVAENVDIVEPVREFTDKIARTEGIGDIYNLGLEAWHPERDGQGPYDLIWIQWCIGQLTDAQLVELLQRLPPVLSPGGWIVVKENLSNHHLGEDVYDETDSSVTRTDGKFRSLFERSGLRLVSTELQKGFPKGLYPVRAYALQPPG